MRSAIPRGGSDGSEPIRIVLADDHAMVREGLRALVVAQPGLVVVGEAENGEEACRLARELEPDVVLLDLSMPGMGGPEAAEHMAEECPWVRVIALTMHDERGYVSRLLRAGAAGYVLKRRASTELVRAIRAVAAGGTYVDPSLAGALLAAPPRRPRAAASGEPAMDVAARAGTLTSRETEVLRLVAQGHSNKEIAEALRIGVKTVDSHKANGMAKLGLSSRAALVRFAVHEGWLADTAR